MTVTKKRNDNGRQIMRVERPVVSIGYNLTAVNTSVSRIDTDPERSRIQVQVNRGVNELLELGR